MPKRALKEVVKMFIVMNLAAYEAPTDIITAVREKYGLKLTYQNLQKYHPLRVNGSELSAELKTLFFETRANFDKHLPPLMIRNVRIKKLSELVERAEDKGNYVLAATFIEQIAKEVGGFYINNRKLNR